MLEGVVGLYNIDLIIRIVWVVQLDENYNSSALFQKYPFTAYQNREPKSS